MAQGNGGWQFVDDEPQASAPATLQPDGTPYPVLSAPKRTLSDRVSEAYDRATSRAGTGEVGSIIRKLEDWFNLDDRMQQGEQGGSPEQREMYRNSKRAKDVRKMRDVWAAMDAADPAWRENGNVVANVARFGADLLGDTAGNANITYALGAGKNIAQRAFTQGGINAGIDALVQGNEVSEDIRDEFDPVQTATQLLAGTLLQGGGELAAKGLGKALGRGETAPDFNSDDFAREEIVGDLNPTHAPEDDIIPEAIGAPLQGIADPTEIQFRTPEEEQIVQDAISEVSNGWGKTPEEIQSDPKMIRNVQIAIEKRGGDNSLLNKEMAPAGELPQAANNNNDAAAQLMKEKQAAETSELVWDPYANNGAGEWIESGRPANDLDGGGMEPPRLIEPEVIEPEVPEAEPVRPVVERLTEALNEAKPLTAEQKKLYTQERSSRLKKVEQARSMGEGEEGYFNELGALKGELPKVEFEGVRERFTPEEVDELFDTIKNSEAFGNSRYDPITARTGLARLLNGELPRPSEIAQLERAFPEAKALVDAAKKRISKGQKVSDFFSNALNLPRSLMASMDLSAPGRQGITLVGTKEFWKSWPAMFKAMGSEKAFKGLMDDIRHRETFPLMEEANLGLTDLGQNLSTREEDFISSWADRIPGVGRVVRGSERAYVGFLNKLRADTFDRLVTKYSEAGIDIADDAKALKDIGRYINNATGRGDLGAANKAAPLLNGLFFSPRLIASRVNLLNPVEYVKLDPIVRKEALRNMMSFGAIATTVATLASYAGYDVETDARSSDFAKLKDGDTRYDILGGFGQYLTLGARLASNETKTLKGDVRELGKGYKADTRVTVIERFLKNKFAPVPGYVRDYLSGTDPVGKPFDPVTDTAELFIPLFLQDAYEIIEEDGLAGVPKAAPGVFGIGTTRFGVEGSKKEPEAGEEVEESNTDEETGSQTWRYVD